MTATVEGETEPYTVIDHRVPVRGAPCGATWRATWGRYDSWEGSDVEYRDIFAAFPLVLAAYLKEEYDYVAGTGPAEDAPDATYAWRCTQGVWRLFENGINTGIRLHSVEVVGL